MVNYIMATTSESNNSEILNSIHTLQISEQELIDSLATTPNMTAKQQESIIDKINSISKMRGDLYKTLSGTNVFFQNALENSSDTLKEQTYAIEVIETELNQSKQQLRNLEDTKNNKIRMIEINSYYGQQYMEHTQIMKIVVFVLILIAVLSILKKKEIISGRLYSGLIAALIAISVIFFLAKRWISLLMRDKTNYQSYDWNFNAASAPKPPSSGDTPPDPWINPGPFGTCIGSNCCSVDQGQVYDSETDKCVNSLETTTNADTTTTNSNTNA